MGKSLEGKVAVVTGAASGIGYATAKLLVESGAKVAFVDYAKDKLPKLTEALGPNAFPFVANLLDGAETSAIPARVIEKLGQIDILYANAGTYVSGDAADGDADAWDKMLNLNVNSVFRLVGATLPHMIERGTGDVIVTSSVAGHTAVPHEPVYSASKFAVQSFVHGVRRQVSKHGIRVGAVAPGPVMTALLDDWQADRRAKVIAEKNTIEPQEIAEAVVFMLTRPRSITIRDLVILPANLDI